MHPFQIKNAVSGYVVGSFFHDAVLSTNMEPTSMWRDTVFIPPLGSVTIWQRYGTDPSNAWEGKTVFHCHFMDHEDQVHTARLPLATTSRRHSVCHFTTLHS